MHIVKKLIEALSSAMNDNSSKRSVSMEEYKKKLAAAVFVSLKQKGFQKKGLNFSLTRNNLVFFLQIQSSQSSTATVWKFTLNIGIVSLQLCQLTDIVKPTIIDSHWRERIGSYLNPPFDKWWTVDDAVSFRSSLDEIMMLLEHKVLPNIFLFRTTADLQHFWQQGHYRGLTQKQQEYYLQLLDGAHRNNIFAT